MIKLVDLLVRKEGLSHEEFVDRWTGEHAELAKDLPELVKYTTSVPRDPEKAGYDGLLELYFEDSDALEAAFESKAGREVTTDATEFVDMEAGPTLVVEENVQLDETE